MTPKERDELAELAEAIAAPLSKSEAKEAVAAMLEVDENMAWALIVRGRTLAKQKGRAA